MGRRGELHQTSEFVEALNVIAIILSTAVVNLWSTVVLLGAAWSGLLIGECRFCWLLSSTIPSVS